MKYTSFLIVIVLVLFIVGMDFIIIIFCFIIFLCEHVFILLLKSMNSFSCLYYYKKKYLFLIFIVFSYLFAHRYEHIVFAHLLESFYFALSVLKWIYLFVVLRQPT